MQYRGQIDAAMARQLRGVTPCTAAQAALILRRQTGRASEPGVTGTNRAIIGARKNRGSLIPPSEQSPVDDNATDQTVNCRRIRRTYLIMTGLNTFALGHIVSINTLFMIDRGLSTVEWNLANAAYSAAMVFFEIPTGVVADTVGRRASFLLSLLVLFLGTVGTLVFAHDLLSFALLSVVFGLGYTFASGALEAWVVDALKAHNYKGTLEDVFSKSGIITALTMLAATTSGAFLGSWNLEIPYIVRAVVLVPLAVFVSVRMFDDGYTTRALTLRTLIPEMNRTARAGFRAGLGNPAIRLLMLSAVFPSAFFLFGWYSWQPYLIQDLGIVAFGEELVWLAGVVSALLLLATTVGNLLAPKVRALAARRSHVLATTTVLASVAILVGGIIPAVVNPGHGSNFYIALGAFLVTMFVFGIQGPMRQGFINDLIDAEERATVLSMDSLVSNIGTTGGVIALGALAQRISDDGGLGIGWAWIVGAPLILIGAPILWRAGRTAGEVDEIHHTEVKAEPA